MAILLGKHINLRALEPKDLDFLFNTENDESFWEISSTQTPFSKYLLKKYIKNAHQDIYQAIGEQGNHCQRKHHDQSFQSSRCSSLVIKENQQGKKHRGKEGNFQKMDTLLFREQEKPKSLLQKE